MASTWDTTSIPNQSGKRVVITGSNSGIGFEAAKVLAAKGAEVILAVRNVAKGNQAADRIQTEFKEAKVEVMELDLADLDSVHHFADAYRSRWTTLELLINNAGVMVPPFRQTKDGFELQFGTNHLGHFALTGRLMDTLLATREARVVVVSSAAHTRGVINFDDLNWTRGYKRWAAYGQSKLANLLFAYELERRLEAIHADVKCVACHPGFAATNLTAAGFGLGKSWIGKSVGELANVFAQSAAMGALPTLYAATDMGLKGGEYIGPTSRSGRNSMRGYPGIVTSNHRSMDQAVAKRLWDVSEELTGVHFQALELS
ncbi:SDR family oxidoreductase [Alicyclobacillus curvatus]|nr:SDR family oxidoreductase [Alicyclobacillus curvatus]